MSELRSVEPPGDEAMGRSKRTGTRNTKLSNGVNLGFKEKLWAAADQIRGHTDAGEYKRVAIGVIFLKH
jgi:hypothetical protein